METINSIDSASEAAKKPPVIEHFAIDGLFGYRSISLTSKFAATILIARNGSGKTTLLAALDAFLRCQFTRFAALRFDKITCKLHGCPEPLVIYRNDVDRLIDLAGNSEISMRAKVWELEPLSLLELLEGGFKNRRYAELIASPTFYSIYTKHGYDYEAAVAQCERLHSTILGKIGSIDRVREILQRVLNDTEIVYLPTYRRIELSLPEPDPRRGEKRKSILSRLGVTRSGLYTADIQFGLSDISDRLRSLYSEMLYLSNQGYGKVSANVINDLISGDYKKEAIPRDPPSKESLEIFFSRIKDAEREYRRAPFGNFFSVPNLDPVYSGDVPADAKPFLNYFLDQLNTVIQETRGTEELVQSFIGNCNRYLSGDDFSAEKSNSDNEYNFDCKELKFNRRNLEVTVVSSITGDELSMESLSSGEKQMISLFARLYLYPGQKIVLIDEPELSLSLDWQRQIIPDVLRAPTCLQTIAITHSPFIFDNELEPFAGSLRLNSSRNITGNLFPPGRPAEWKGKSE